MGEGWRSEWAKGYDAGFDIGVKDTLKARNTYEMARIVELEVVSQRVVADWADEDQEMGDSIEALERALENTDG